jgi:hypothetical protein
MKTGWVQREEAEDHPKKYLDRVDKVSKLIEIISGAILLFYKTILLQARNIIWISIIQLKNKINIKVRIRFLFLTISILYSFIKTINIKTIKTSNW